MSSAEPQVHHAGQEQLRDESVGQLLGDLSRDMSTLVRQEIQLARVELSGKAAELGRPIGMIAGAVLAGLLTLGALTAFLIILFDLGMPTWAAALVVTLIWAIVAAALASTGRARLREFTPTPEQTIDTLKEDVQWAKNLTTSGTTSKRRGHE